MKEDLQPNPKLFLRTNTIIYSALLAGQALFAVVAYSIAINPALNLKPLDDMFFYMAPVFTIAMGVIGSILYKRKTNEAANAVTLKDKMAGYQTAMIIRFALSEGATLFTIVIFLMGYNLYYLLIAGINILYFLLLRPTSVKMEADLNLSYEDKLEL